MTSGDPVMDLRELIYDAMQDVDARAEGYFSTTLGTKAWMVLRQVTQQVITPKILTWADGSEAVCNSCRGRARVTTTCMGHCDNDE